MINSFESRHLKFSIKYKNVQNKVWMRRILAIKTKWTNKVLNTKKVYRRVGFGFTAWLNF